VRASVLAVETFNNFLPGDIRVVGPDADIPRFKAYLSRAAELLAHAAAQIIVYGSGWARNVPEGYERSRGEDEFAESLRLSADALKGTGTTLVIEPLNRRESNLVNSVAEGADFVRRVNRPEIQLLADFYHMDEEHEPLATLPANAAYLRHVYLADTGRINPGSGRYPYAAFVGALKEAGYAGRFSAECGVTDKAQDMHASVVFLRNILC
jgi:sugar phosphate isomerase/epimerase